MWNSRDNLRRLDFPCIRLFRDRDGRTATSTDFTGAARTRHPNMIRLYFAQPAILVISMELGILIGDRWI